MKIASMVFALMFCCTSGRAAILGESDGCVDFNREIGTVRRELHSSGWAPRVTVLTNPKATAAEIENVRSFNMKFARTHDWALVNPGQRVIDTHFIFPLGHLDAKDPANYVFGPTDHILDVARSAGLEIFYRLGTSIEHTGEKVHFNALIPEDFDKTADVFAGIVRHYNKGWGKDGKTWDIRYWEIWNEPDGLNNMWCMPGGDAGQGEVRQEKFVRFFVTVLKRLKAEFPDIKVGGPAMCWCNESYFRAIFEACRSAGVAPDFMSWHYYGNNPSDMTDAAEKARLLCDEYGFTKCELIINEWHYMDSSWYDLRSPNPAVVSRVQDGPTGHNGIDSAVFTLSALSRFQTSKLDQAYYYGCSHTGSWGYMNDRKEKNKNFYACRLFGSLMPDGKAICQTMSNREDLTVFAVKRDGGVRSVLIADYRGCDQVVVIDVDGVGEVKRVEAVVLDSTRDNLPCDVRYEAGKLTLVKPDKYSSAWLVTFVPDEDD